MSASYFRTAPTILFSSGLAITMICAVSVSAGERNTGGTKWLDVIRLHGDDESRTLALVQVHPLNPPATLAQLESAIPQYKKLFPKGDNWQSFTDQVGTIAFMVVRPEAGLSAKALTGEQVVGLVYAHTLRDPKALRPARIWSGRLVHSRALKQTYAVLARGSGEYLTLAVFSIEPERKLGEFPLEFPIDKLASWPKPLQAISEKVINFYPDRDGWAELREINVVADKKGLIIAVHTRVADRSPHYFRYDFEEKAWTTAKVVVGEPVK